MRFPYEMYKSRYTTDPTLAPATQTRRASRNETRLIRETFPTRKQTDFGHSVTVCREFFLNQLVGHWNNLS